MLQDVATLLGLSPHLDPWRLAALVGVALLVGMGKSGLSGVGLLAIPLLASTVGALPSTGLMLLLLISGDVFAVSAYRRHADGRMILRLLPATLAGIAIGAVVGRFLSPTGFRWAIAAVVVVCLVLMVFQEWKGADKAIPHSVALALLIGAASGFATMVGNAAGPIFAVYLLAMGFDKSRFLGTSAVFFLIVNLTKVPIQVVLLHNIGWTTVLSALALLPAVGLGLWVGLKLLKLIPEKAFRRLVIAMTALAAVRLMLP